MTSRTQLPKPVCAELEERARATGDLIHAQLAKDPHRAWKMEDALKQPFSPNTARTAALLIIHALAQTMLKGNNSYRAVAARWRRQATAPVPTRYLPVLPLVLKLLETLEQRKSRQIMTLALQAAGSIRHALPGEDLTGQILQRFSRDRKENATFFTKPNSAILMAHLAIPEELDWSKPQLAKNYRIADYACGSGTLLMAAYHRVRELHREGGGKPEKLHAGMMKNSLTGVDTLPANVAVCAANLAFMEPGVQVRRTRMVKLHYGIKDNGSGTRNPMLGSLDLLDPDTARQQKPAALIPGGEMPVDLEPGTQDLVLMNPPFTKPVPSLECDQNFPDPAGDIPATSEEEAQHIAQRARDLGQKIEASNGGGMAYYFAHLAHRMVKPGGTIALLLPLTILTGSRNLKGKAAGWQEFRRILAEEYADVTVLSIAQYRDTDATFSEDTTIAEVMVVARRLQKGEHPPGTGHFVNLSRGPRNPGDAAEMSRRVKEAIHGMTPSGAEDVQSIVSKDEDLGTVTRTELSPKSTWLLARVLDPQLVKTVLNMSNGREPGIRIPTTQLETVAESKSDGWDQEQIFHLDDNTPGQATLPVLARHDSETQQTMSLQPQHGMKKTFLRRWNKAASRLQMNVNLRYNSQRTTAVVTTEPCAGRRGWGGIRMTNPRGAEKAMAAWMNTTPGLMFHWIVTNHTQNGLGLANKQQIDSMPVLDLRKLDDTQLMGMAQVFDDYAQTPFLAASDAWQDPARMDLDRRVLQDVLGLDDRAMERARELTERWCLEPSVQGKRAHAASRKEDIAQLRQAVASRQNEPNQETEYNRIEILIPGPKPRATGGEIEIARTAPRHTGEPQRVSRQPVSPEEERRLTRLQASRRLSQLIHLADGKLRESPAWVKTKCGIGVEQAKAVTPEQKREPVLQGLHLDFWCPHCIEEEELVWV